MAFFAPLLDYFVWLISSYCYLDAYNYSHVLGSKGLLTTWPRAGTAASQPVAVFIAGLCLGVEAEAPGNFCIREKIIRVWEMPLRMIKMMNTLSDEIPREKESGTF